MAPSVIPGEITHPSYKWRPEIGLVTYGAPFDVLAKAHIERLGGKRVLLIVSGSLARNTKEVEKLEETLSSLVVAKRVGMKPHSDWQEILDVTEQARKAKVDLLLTVGGGSIIDAAKVVILAMANPSVTADNLDSLKNIMSDASMKVRTDMNPATTPLICIPTTLSAGEYSGFAAATDPRDHTKRIFAHPPSITPSVVILDPVLGRMSPAEVWFPSGVRAMDHCIELLCRVTHPDPDVDESAKKGLVLLAKGLLYLKTNADDDQARLNTLLGGCYSMDGICKKVPVGAAHAIGHSLGALGVDHGVTSCIISPAVMKYNKIVNATQQAVCLETLWSDITIAQALKDFGLNKKTADLGDCLDALFRTFGVPRTLREVGFEGEEKIMAAAKNTLLDPFAATNARPLLEASQAEEIIRAAL